jgi:cytoskeleton protein RodZ
MLKNVNTNNDHRGSSTDLKAIREEKGLSLKEISTQTRISVSVLDAIEKGKYHLLPEPVYTRGFIRTYAQLLEINSEDVLSSYNAYIDELEQSQQQVEKERRAEKSRTRYTLAGVFIAVLLIMFIIFIMSSGFEEHAPSPAPPPPTAEAVKEIPPVPLVTTAKDEKATTVEDTAQEAGEDTTAPALHVEEQPSAPMTSAAEAEITPPSEKPRQGVPPATESEGAAQKREKPYVLEIEASELTWLNIIADFEPKEEILMKPGEKITRKASEKFILYIGNAGGINVSFQGTPLGPLGEHGKVIRLVLPRATREGGNAAARSQPR